MSHPMYNPFATGKQTSPQGPYGLSGGQMERDPRRPLPHLGSGSSFSSSGTSSVNRGPTGGPLPSLLSLQVNYRPERKKISVDEDIDRCLDLNISRAREEAMQNFAGQNSQFPKAQRDMFSSSNTGMPSFLKSSGDSGSTPLDWAPAEESSKMYSSASPSFLSSGDVGIQAPIGFRDYDSSMSDQSGPPHKYTSESATNILLHFGLQKEDLDHLTLYPEDQITPENLPYILRQIRLEKGKITPTALHQSQPYSESQSIRSVGEMNKLSTSRGPMLNPDELSTFLQPSNVIDYRHTSKSELSSFGQLNKDTDLRQLMSEVPTTLQLKKPGPAQKTQPSKPPCKLIHGIHPGRPGLVLIHSNAESHSNDQTRSGGQPSKVTKKKKKKKTNARPQQWQQVQMLQQPTQPEGFPATKPTPLLLIPGRAAPPTRGPSRMGAMSHVGPSDLLPTPAMMQDYAAATPRIFPHTCCLCMKECTSMKDWLSHQNTGLHLESCRRLRGRYPEWDGRTLEFLSALGKDARSEPSTPGQNLQNRHQKSIHEALPYSLSPHHQRGSEDRKEKQDRREKRFSPSRSHSPYLHHGSESRRERQSSRSRSPQASRYTHRSRSRSYDRPTSSHYRSRSRSYERRSPPRKREAKWPSPRRSHEHRSSPRRSDDKRSSPRRSHERWSPAERSVPQRKRSRSADRLAKRLLEKTGVQSLSKQSDLEAMVKTLAPVLLAELANLKSSSAATSSSSSKTEKKASSTKSTKATSSHSKRRTSSSAKSMVARSMSSSKVSLSGVFTSLSHADMVEAMEKLGKVKSVILYRSTLQAQVHFEKEDDAKKLQSLQSYQVKGLPVYIDRPTGAASEKPPLTKEQKTAPQKKPASSSATKSQTTKSYFTGRVKKPLSSEAKNTTTAKLVTRAKVLVSKAKGVSTKQVAKTVKKPTANRKVAVKSVGGKKEASVVPKSKTPGKRPHECPSDSSNNKGQPTPETSSSVSQTPSTSARSVYKDIGKAGSTFTDVKARKQNAEKVANAPHKTAAELPQMDVDIFKVLTTEINKHRRSKGITSESKDKESTTKSRTTPEDTKKENKHIRKDKNKDFSSGRFNELDFTSGDFVTVDEINEEMDDTTVEDHPSSSKTTSREKKDRRSSAVHSAARKISARSASSSSKPAKGNLSSRSTSVSANKRKSVSEPKKSSSGQKTSLSTSSKSVEMPTSSGQKAQLNKRKPSVTSSEPSSSGSSLSAIKLSGETKQAHKKGVKPRERTLAKSDHKASAESCAANTVESNSETSSQMALSAEGQMETDFKDETVKEIKKSRGKEKKKDTDGKSTEEEKGNKENKKIIDSPNIKTDEQEHKEHKEENQDRRTETQIPEPAQDQIIHQGGLQVVASAENDEACSDECHEMEIDEPTKLQDSAPEDQAATADDGDEGPTKMQVSEKDETKGAHSSEGSSVRGTPDRNQVTSEDTDQIQSSSGVAADVKQKEEILLSEKICETSKEVGQISSEVDQPLENNDGEDTLKVQKHVGPTDLLPKADDEPTEEEVYQVIDSLEDQPTTTEAEPETEKKDRKKGDATTSGDDRPTTHDRSRSRTSKGQEKEKSSKKQERTIEKHEETKEMKKEDEEKSHEDFEEMIYEVVDSIEDDSVQETSTTRTSGRKRSARGNKKDEKTSAPVKEPKKSDKEEEMFTVLDSVEEESPSDKPVVTRSTRGRKDKKVEETSKTREDKTPTRRRCTPARDFQEKDRDKTLKPDVSVPLKESTPTKKSDAVVANTNEEDATYKELDAVRDDRPITQKSRRGRQKKDNKTSKKETEEQKPAFQIVGSLGVVEFREKTTTVACSLQNDSETKDEMAANVTTVPSVSSPLDLQQAIRKEENLLELEENTMEVKEDPSAEGSDAEKSTSETDLKKDDKSSLNQPNGKRHGLENRKESPKTNNTTAAIGVSLNIDQFGAKEENYPQDATEEAELKKIQAAATKTENEQGDRSMERETVARRTQSSVEGGESGKTTRDDEQNREEDIDEVEIDGFGSVILHEAGENAVSEAVPWDGTISEGEPQELVALNEIAENEEDPKEKPIMPGAQPQIQEGQLVDPLKTENFSALDEAGQTEDKKADEDDTIQTSSSSKRKHSDDPDVDKQRQELSGPEAKRSCSQSPSVPVDLQLPPFNPENPLGEEFVVPKSGFFCNLCSVFYLNESTAKKIHCSSQKHYENLLKHYQKLQQKTSGTTPCVQD